MARYIDADKLIAHLEGKAEGEPVFLITMRNLKASISFLETVFPADVVPKSEVERLQKALAAQELEYSQALQDKARECNMAIDKICLEHRAKIALLHSSHEQELAEAKIEVAREIFAELDTMDIRIVRLHDAIKYIDLVKKHKYKEGE